MKQVLSFLFVIFLCTPSFCQEISGISKGKPIWKKNGIVVNDSIGRSIRQNAKVVSLDDSSYVVVWEDDRDGYTDIYAQRFNQKGAKLWGQSGIPVCEYKKNQTFPQIINAGKNSVIIVWQDYRNENSDIYAQKLDVKGNTVWDKDTVSVCRAQANQLTPQLCTDGDGGAIITWYDYRSGRGEDIYAQRINSVGSSEWQADGISICVEQATQWYPQIEADGKGGAIICWDDKRSGYYDIYAQRIGSNGTSMWQANGIAISSAPENQQYSQIGTCSDDSFVVAWQDYRNGNADIYAQCFDLTGRMLWKTNGEIICNVAGNQERPIVVSDSNMGLDNSPIIIWTDYRNGTGNSDIFSNKIARDGKLQWGVPGVGICGSSGNQGSPKASIDGEGGAIVAWQDERSPMSGIFARRITRDGKAIWVPDGKTICATNNSAEFPLIAHSPGGNTLIAWQDKRLGGLDVYAQNIDPQGSLLWKTNGLVLVNSLGSVSQQKPRIIKCGKGEYLIIWEDFRNGFSNIFAQKINNTGNLLWGIDGKKICNASGNQTNPDVVSDDEMGAIIIWEDYRETNPHIYAQRIDQVGQSIWDENGIMICDTANDKTNPKIVKDGLGGAITFWQEPRKGSNALNVFAQNITKNGNILWKPEGVQLSGSGNIQTDIKVREDGEGGAVAAWVEYKGNINTPDIFAQRITKTGEILWGLKALSVCKAPEAQRNPDLAAGSDYIIVWEDSGGGNYDIYSQKINKDGTIAWACDGVPVCTFAFTQHDPKLILSGDGGAVIVWEDYRKANWDIYAQRVDTAGNLVWNKDSVAICTAPGTQYSPQIIKGPEGSSIVVWEDYRNNKGYGIYAQKLSADGDIVWDKDGLAVCITDGGSRSPQVIDDGEGGAIVVWTDYRYGSYDIYAQRINEDSSK